MGRMSRLNSITVGKGDPSDGESANVTQDPDAANAQIIHNRRNSRTNRLFTVRDVLCGGEGWAGHYWRESPGRRHIHPTRLGGLSPGLARLVRAPEGGTCDVPNARPAGMLGLSRDVRIFLQNY